MHGLRTWYWSLPQETMHSTIPDLSRRRPRGNRCFGDRSIDILCSFQQLRRRRFSGSPGTDIVTTDTNDGYTSITGTSASAAIVAGVAAL